MSGDLFSSAQFATLVVCTINANRHRDDLLASDSPFEFGCCPRCCAGCAVLKELMDADALNFILRYLAPEELGVTGYDWWDTKQDCFDLSWAHAWWNRYPCPNHE